MNKIFQPDDYVAVHENPVWRDKSDFIIRACLEDKEDRNEWEQLWVKQLAEQRFSICCIPFFAFNLALGDEVETDSNFVLSKVVKASGQITFRVWFGNSTQLGIKDGVISQIKKIGALFEWSSANLLAVSAKDANQAQQVANYLYSREQMGELQYETGLTGERQKPK